MLVRTYKEHPYIVHSVLYIHYINDQGGLRPCPLYKLAHQILVWSQEKLLSLRAVHIPGHLSAQWEKTSCRDRGRGLGNL